MIPGSANPLLLKSAAAAAGGLQISRSLRFNSSDSAYLSRTPAVAGNRRTWTWSGWVKRSVLGSTQGVFEAGTGSGTDTWAGLFFNSSNQIFCGFANAGSNDTYIQSTAVFRDCSAWYHIVLAVDTTNATNTDRVKLYVNNERITVFSDSAYGAPNTDSIMNTTNLFVIGQRRNSSTAYFNGYLTNIHFIDGQALTPSSFTETDATTGQLIPKTYTGSYGTNGFNLLFADNSSNTASTLGKDTSGLSNNWTPVNLSVAAKVWSTQTTTSGNYSLYAGSPAGAFTGGTSGIWQWSGTTAVVKFIPTPAITYSSQVRVRVEATGNIANTRWSVNGGSLQSFASSGAQWLTILSGSGTLTEFGFHMNGDPFTMAFSAVEVDGVILADSAPSGIDSLVDSPTNYGTDTGVGGTVRGNYCTWNPLSKGTDVTLANGNLDMTSSSAGGNTTCSSTFGVSSGKWYWEVTCTGSDPRNGIGVAKNGVNLNSYLGSDAFGWSYSWNAYKYNNASGASYGVSYTASDVIGVALDADSGTLTFYKNGTSQGQAYSNLTSGPFFPAIADDSGGGVAGGSLNAGQRAFAYTAPSGFKALCTQNLPEGTITTSGTFTGNASADGPFVYLNGVPTAMTINSNAVTFATHADKLSNGFKLRTSSGSYNTAGSNTYSITTTGAKFKYARAQPNP